MTIKQSPNSGGVGGLAAPVLNSQLETMPSNTVKVNSSGIAATPVNIPLAANELLGVGSTGVMDGITLSSAFSMSGNLLDVPEVGAYFSYVMDTSSTADSDPGSNKIKCNNANQTLATQWYLDDIDRGTRDITGFIGNWGTGGTLLMLSSTSYLALNLSAITDATGYTKFTATYIAGAGFANGTIIFMTYLDGQTTPTYDDLAAPALPSPVTYPDFVAMIRNVSGNTLGRPGIFKSNGVVYNGVGRIILDHDNISRKVYAINTALTWTVANSGGFLQLTSSAAHGIAIANNYADSYLHVKTASGSFFPLDGLIQIDDVTSTTVILTSVAWDAGMTGATPVFSAAGEKFKIYTSAVPAMRANSRLIIDANWEYTNSANNKTVEMMFAGVSYYAPPAVTTSGVMYTPIEIYNKNSVNLQESRTSITSNTGTSTAGARITSTINTAVATSLTWHGTCAAAGEYIGQNSRLVEMIY